MSASENESLPRIVIVVGARPNFMKAAPVLRALAALRRVRPVLVHTGQHYDARMSDLFFRDLGLPEPDENLGVGSGSHAKQTGEVMARFEAFLDAEVSAGRRPAAVVVVGDVNSTLAAALVSAKASIPVAHVEAGLRSFDRTMPEELNRILTDRLADVCYVTEPAGIEHLDREGRRGSDVVMAGNTMIDSLLVHRERARSAGLGLARSLGLDSAPFAVCTLHRPSNVDEAAPLARVVDALRRVATRLPIVWPMHPRTRARLAEFGLEHTLESTPAIRRTEPLGYLDFLGLMDRAALVLTDSGGIQEEATVLKLPCVTLRENTERPITIEMGGNVLAGNDPSRVSDAANRMLAVDRSKIGVPPMWDGKAGERIAADLVRRFLPREVTAGSAR